MSDLPIFAFCNADVQASQLRSFYRSLGADVSETSEGEERDSMVLVELSPILATKMESEMEIEMVLNSIVSLIISVPLEAVEAVVTKFCDQLKGPEFTGKAPGAVVRVLSNLFHGFSEAEKRILQYRIYCALLKVAGSSGLLWQIPTNLPTLNKWFEEWGLSVDDKRACLRLLHEAMVKSGQTEAPAKVMLELLGTYTDADAQLAKQDAIDAIRTAIQDPGAFIFDHLLSLKPVKILSKEKVYQLLQIFVSGSLKDYQTFYQANKAFIEDSLKLNNEACIQKMRILSLMSLAENRTQLTFQELANELQLSQGEELEEFIIKAVMAKVLKAKLDQLGQRLVVGGVRNRQFGKAQWEQLRNRLDQWEQSLSQVRNVLDTVTIES